MKFTLVSDLHIGGLQPNIPWAKCDTDILVIAGDTTNSIGDTAKALRYIARFFETVILIDGNHEFYANANARRSIDDASSRLSELIPDNVIHLNHANPSFAIDGVRFVGAMGWYMVEPDRLTHWRKTMNDDRWIGFDFGESPSDYAIRDAGLVEYHLMHSPETRNVVITHTAPSSRSVLWKENDAAWNEMNPYYFNPLMEKVMAGHADKIAVWCHGHTHERFDHEIEGVRVVTNPRGYRNENPFWAPITIDLTESS